MTASRFLCFGSGPNKGDTGGIQGVLEVSASVAFVRYQSLAGSNRAAEVNQSFRSGVTPVVMEETMIPLLKMRLSYSTTWMTTRPPSLTSTYRP